MKQDISKIDDSTRELIKKKNEIEKELERRKFDDGWQISSLVGEHDILTITFDKPIKAVDIRVKRKAGHSYTFDVQVRNHLE